MQNEVLSLLRAALECSIYINPLEPGLFGSELVEIGKAAGFQPGEINDMLPQVGQTTFGGGGFITPDVSMRQGFLFFHHEEPSWRDPRACDFVVTELVKEEKAEGVQRARLDRAVIVARAVAEGISESSIQIAITTLVMGGSLEDNKGVIRFQARNAGIQRGLPSDMLRAQGRASQKPYKAKAYPLVKDVIARRSDGRLEQAEPLDAFGSELAKIGYGHFRTWWARMVAELRRSDDHSSPVAVAVLAAALVEGSLTFSARFARDRRLSAFQSSNFDGEPRSWKIEKLIESAAAARILDGPTRAQADALTLFRQRIHAGRMLSDHPGGVPDISPEQSRAAKSTADLVTRRVIDWLVANSTV